MPTNWNTLHVRFASSIRDGVSSASVSGLELTSADRDSYLNYAYEQYVRLIHIHNPGAIDRIIPELTRSSTIAPSSGYVSVPTDFGYLINVVNLASTYAQVVYLEPTQFEAIKRVGDTHQSAPSSTMMYYTIKGRDLYILPASSTDSLLITYILKAGSILYTDSDSNDIAIPSNHWDTIIDLAKAKYYDDKQEFELGNKFLQSAILSSPYKIGAIK